MTEKGGGEGPESREERGRGEKREELKKKRGLFQKGEEVENSRNSPPIKHT